MFKLIKFCADDFGMAPGINSGILELAYNGRLSALSCMSRGHFFSQEAQALVAIPVETGLHLNLTEKFNENEFHQPLSHLIWNCFTRKIDPLILTVEIETQLDAFETTLGRVPDYIDGHQHVHQLPVVRDCLIEVLMRRYPGRLPWLRSTLSRVSPGIPPIDQLKAWFIASLGANSLRDLANRFGFAMNANLFGVYNFKGGKEHYCALLMAWLACARSNDLIMCHPAKFADTYDSLGQQRVVEHAVLAGDQFPLLLERYGAFLNTSCRASSQLL